MPGNIAVLIQIEASLGASLRGATSEVRQEFEGLRDTASETRGRVRDLGVELSRIRRIQGIGEELKLARQSAREARIEVRNLKRGIEGVERAGGTASEELRRALRLAKDEVRNTNRGVKELDRQLDVLGRDGARNVSEVERELDDARRAARKAALEVQRFNRETVRASEEAIGRLRNAGHTLFAVGAALTAALGSYSQYSHLIIL